MRPDRREFLSGMTASLTLLASPFASARAQMLKRKNLVLIMLRGGMDGLTAVPSTESVLKSTRPNIAVTGVRKLTNDFSLHPKLETFFKLWQANRAAIVHATSIPYQQRSHFEGQNLMETGGHVPYESQTGWLGRGLQAAGLGGLALSLPMPLILRSESETDNFFPTYMRLPSDQIMAMVRNSYEPDTKIHTAIGQILKRPRSMLSLHLREKRDATRLAETAAMEMRRPDGPRVAVFEIEGFDTHAAQGGTDGEHGEKLAQLDRVIEVLHENLEGDFANTLILTLTEFGRKIEQNGGYGTEHGYGTAILMAGGLLKKAQIHTDWPGLRPQDRFEGQDLNATIDARAIYCSAMASCFDVDFDQMRRQAFWGETLPDYTETLFKS